MRNLKRHIVFNRQMILYLQQTQLLKNFQRIYLQAVQITRDGYG